MAALRVAVLGAGLQGTCVALELAARSVQVDLFDRCVECMTQASAQNEGKIHLGYVYGNDPSLRTARMMAAGALSFAPLMARWLGPEFADVNVSTPFYYLVHRRSLLAAADIARYLRRVHQLHLEAGEKARDHYFGIDLRPPPARLEPREYDGLFDAGAAVGVFRTPEIAIDPEALAALVRKRVASEGYIRPIMQAAVTRVTQRDRGASVEFENSSGRHAEFYDHVVNALWESRLAIDLTAGVKPDRPWLYRVKHFLRIRNGLLAAGLPSVTMVLGPFGDVVNYGNGEAYLSWYPAGMQGMSKDIRPPDWLPARPELAARLKQDIPAGLAEIVPQIARLSASAMDRAEVRGGHIFAWGQTDIDDMESGLHERYAIGPRSVGRYHSVDTGKLTMAPLFAKQVADRICASLP